MDKLQMAHEMALELVKIKPGLSAWQIADRCFEYADAMQKEADERKPKGLPQALSPEVTHLNNTLAAQKMVHDDEFQATGYEP